MKIFICMNYSYISFDDLIDNDLSNVLMKYLANNIYEHSEEFLQIPINDILIFE